MILQLSSRIFFGGQLFLLLLLLIAATGCAGPEKVRGELRYGTDQSPEGPRVYFPPPPESPRYYYGGELVGEKNFFFDQQDKSFGRVVFEWLTGINEKQEPLELLRPQSVVTDSKGRVYVSDMGRSAVFVFDVVDGEPRVLKRFSAFKTFIAPSGLAIGPNDDLFVVDAELGAVGRLSSAGDTLLPIGEGLLKRPAAVVFDKSQQRILVSDSEASDIKVFDLDGRLIMTIGKSGVALGEFNRPTYMAVWRNELYVTDTFNSRLQVFDLDSGQPIREIGTRGTFVGQFAIPKGVALDSDGNIYVIESLFDHLLIFNREGQLLLPIGGTGYNSGSFYLPAGLWIDERDRIYVADMYNGRVVTYHYLESSSESTD